MSNIESYFGVKEILLPEIRHNGKYSGNLLWQCVNPAIDNFSRILNAIKIFEDEPVIVIYNKDSNGIPKETLEECRFMRGYLKTDFRSRKVTDHTLWLGNKVVPLRDVVDIVSENHLEKNVSENIELKLFTFNIADDRTDLYHILHVNSVLAYLSADNSSSNASLKLLRIEKPYQGMQFNRGKGNGRIEDVL
jgi:hypothetical protein